MKNAMAVEAATLHRSELPTHVVPTAGTKGKAERSAVAGSSGKRKRNEVEAFDASLAAPASERAHLNGTEVWAGAYHGGELDVK